jgi:hypothetical protein
MMRQERQQHGFAAVGVDETLEGILGSACHSPGARANRPWTLCFQGFWTAAGRYRPDWRRASCFCEGRSKRSVEGLTHCGNDDRRDASGASVPLRSRGVLRVPGYALQESLCAQPLYVPSGDCRACLEPPRLDQRRGNPVGFLLGEQSLEIGPPVHAMDRSLAQRA